MKHYDSINNISIQTFYDIVASENYSLLIKKKKNRKNLSIKDLKELHSIFKNITREYCIATNNFKIVTDLKKNIYISKLEYKYFLLSKILATFEKYEEIEVLWVLDSLGYSFKKNEDIDSEMKKLILDFKHLKNKINIAKLKYNKKDKSEEQKEFDLDSLALNLERALDLKYRIDTTKTSMKRWINLNNLAKKINNEQNRITSNRGN